MNEIEYQANYYQKNKEKLTTYKKEWRINHKEKIKQYGKMFKKQNPDYHKTYWKEHKTELTEKKKDFRNKIFNQSPWLKSYENIRSRKYYKQFKNRKLQFTITREQIKELWFRDRAYDLIIPSVDRINSKLGYTYDNCRFIEWVDNWFREFYPDYELQYKILPKSST